MISSTETTKSNFEQITVNDNNIDISNSGVQWVPSASLKECNTSTDPQLCAIALKVGSVVTNDGTHHCRRDHSKKEQNVLTVLQRKQMHRESALQSRNRFNVKFKALVDLIPASYRAKMCMMRL